MKNKKEVVDRLNELRTHVRVLGICLEERC